MTTEAFNPPSPITIATVGPHGFTFPYEIGTVTASVEAASGTITDLIFGTDYTISPASAETGGNLTLSGPAFATHTGGKLHISRGTAEQQGFVGTQGNREKGMEKQLDRLTRRVQELARMARSSVRALMPPLKPFVPVAGKAIIFDAFGQPMNGPDATAISGAQAQATAAAASAVAAAASAASAGTQDTTFLQQSTRNAVMGGTAAAMTLTTSGSITSAVVGQRFQTIATVAPAAAATLKIDGMTAATVYTWGGAPVPANHWAVGAHLTFTYTGTFWFAEPANLYGNVSAIYSRGSTATFTSGIDVSANLTAELFNQGALITQSAGQYTLLGGRYFVRWSLPAHEVDGHISWLRNVTDSQTPIIGVSAYAPTGITSESRGAGIISFAGVTVFELRRRCTTTKVGNGFGRVTGIVNGDGLPVDLFGLLEFIPLKP